MKQNLLGQTRAITPETQGGGSFGGADNGQDSLGALAQMMRQADNQSLNSLPETHHSPNNPQFDGASFDSSSPFAAEANALNAGKSGSLRDQMGVIGGMAGEAGNQVGVNINSPSGTLFDNSQRTTDSKINQNMDFARRLAEQGSSKTPTHTESPFTITKSSVSEAAVAYEKTRAARLAEKRQLLRKMKNEGVTGAYQSLGLHTNQNEGGMTVSDESLMNVQLSDRKQARKRRQSITFFQKATERKRKQRAMKGRGPGIGGMEVGSKNSLEESRINEISGSLGE